MVSRLVKQDKPNSKRKGKIVYEKDQYYYHPDHLGTTAYITHTNGQIYQHLEYFPFGETWVEEHSNKQRTPYLFTAKELDEETGLYYFGARYYDPRTSVWQSPDPILENYFPKIKFGESRLVAKISVPDLANGFSAPFFELRGKGGVYNSKNLSMYSYSHNNPVNFVDPDGREVSDSAIKVIKDNLINVRDRVSGLNLKFKSERAKLATYSAAAGYFENLDSAAIILRDKNTADIYKEQLTHDLRSSALNKYLPKIAKEAEDAAFGTGGTFSGTPVLKIIGTMGKTANMATETIGAGLSASTFDSIGDLSNEIIEGVSPGAVDKLEQIGIHHYANECSAGLNCGD